MATAAKKRITVTQLPVYQERVDLELSTDEAQFLRDICGSIWGTSPGRRLADNIFSALANVGIAPGPYKFKNRLEL